jgi:ribosome-associated protein
MKRLRGILRSTTFIKTHNMSDTSIKREIQKLQRTLVDALEDVKAKDIQVFDTEHLSPLFERVLVASGTSNRQTRALAASVRDALRDAGFDKPRIEGEDNGEWVIVDCGSAVVHIMQPVIREYYRLEEIWGEKPVRIKIASKSKGLVKAESAAPKSDRVAKTGRADAKQAAAKTPVKKAATAGTKPAAPKAAPKKRAVSSSAPKPAQKVAVKTAAKKAVAKTATKATAKKTVTKKPVASKTATKPAAKSTRRPAAK